MGASSRFGARFFVCGMVCCACVSACGGGSDGPVDTAKSGVVFTFPRDGQVDVPTGARIVATFSDPVTAGAVGACSGSGSAVSGGFCLVGPDGPVDATPTVVGSGYSVQLDGLALAPGTTYQLYASAALAPTAENLPASGPLVTFTTRSTRLRAAAPTLVAVNGAAIADAGSGGYFDESNTIRLLFSEPLDRRTVTSATAQLVDSAGSAVPADVYCDGIHVSIDPVADLAGSETYTVKLSGAITDVSGTPLVATTHVLMTSNSHGSGVIHEVLRTRQPMDPGTDTTFSGATKNVITIDKPLIGHETVTVKPASIAAELGDPTALDGPVAFTIRRGQRLSTTGLDIKLGGDIESGLSTGDVYFEFLTDSGGRLYRNPHQDPSQVPDNDKAPVYVDLAMDIGVFAVDPSGNAVLAQTILGVQAVGTAVATDGVLDIETVGALDMGLLGVTAAPTNLVLELITDAAATVPKDTTPPALLTSLPADMDTDAQVDRGVELIFSEPIDVAKARAGGIALADASGKAVPNVLEAAGSVVVIRPLAPLAYGTTYTVNFDGVTDVAGNALTASPLSFATPKLVATGVAATVAAVQPGAPCSLTGANATSPGRCSSGSSSDDLYHPFTLAADLPVVVQLSSPVQPKTIVLGSACNTGTFRVEALNGSGACAAAIAGSVDVHDRVIEFVPDVPWTVGASYRVTMVSGGDKSCNPNEICGVLGAASSFDPLGGTTSDDGGGPNLVEPFTAVAPNDHVVMIAGAEPYTDVNASGYVDAGETRHDSNRAGMNITDTSGVISDASFEGPDCLLDVDGTQPCLYLSGAMPVEMGDLQMGCALPDGTTAATCIPVTMTPAAMYGTSVTMDATVVISISTDTGTSVMRVREPSGGPVTGYIIAGTADGSGSATPEMEVQLSLYMDAPDMSITDSSHDLHSKPLKVTLVGPVQFQPDGRIAIALSNTADISVVVNVSVADPFDLDGAVTMVIPKSEMKLQLLSPPLRGGAQ